MGKRRRFGRVTVSLILAMTLERLSVFAGAYQMQASVAGVDSLLFALILTGVVLLASRNERLRFPAVARLAVVAFGLVAGGSVLLVVIAQQPSQIGSCVQSVLMRGGVLLFLVANMRMLAMMPMTKGAQVLTLAACVSCVAVPAGYLFLLADVRFWYALILVVLACGCVAALRACAGGEELAAEELVAASGAEGSDTRTEGASSAMRLSVLASLGWPLACYLGANVLLDFVRLNLLLETGSTFLSDAIPPLGMVAGSLGLLAYWRKEEVLFKDRRGFPLFTTILALLFAAMPFVPIQGQEGTLLVVCTLYEACFLVLMAACIEQRRHRGVSLLESWCGCMAIYYALQPLSDSAAQMVDDAFGHGFQGLCVTSLFVLLALFLFNVAATARSARNEDGDCCVDVPSSTGVNAPAEGSSPVGDVRACEALVSGARISPRELDVLELVLGARSVPRIAGELYVSENTVKAHMKSIYAKLGVHSRQELIDVVSAMLGSR